MKLLRDLAELPDHWRHGAVTIGNFDGVHRGHAELVRNLRRSAKQVGGPSVVFTFEPHPVRVLRPDEAPPPLTWTERKAELLAELGVDAVIVCPTTPQLLALSADEFFRQIVVERLAARAIIEGPNFHFGRGREGDIQRLAALCEAAGIQLAIVEPVEADNAGQAEFVSSSRVRAALKQGDTAHAADLLGRPYRLRGMVTHGAGRGAQIGFPTANLDAIDTLVPAHGVYAARAVVDDTPRPAAVHIGPNPTFGESLDKVECHVIGFKGSLYGQVLEVDFLRRLRTIRTFSSVEELTQQLQRDIAAAQQAAGDPDP